MNETNEEKLLPCSHCGKAAESMSACDDSYEWFYVRCTECFHQSGTFDTPAEARAAWNRRATPAPEWTTEITTDYSKIHVAYCNDGRKRIVEFHSNSFVIVNGNIRCGINIRMFIEKYNPLWYSVPLPALPGKEGQDE